MSDELETELLMDAMQRRRVLQQENRNDHRPYRMNNDVDNLIKICTRKIALDIHHPKALFIRASSYMKKGLYEETIKDCNALIQIEPDHVGAFYLRGCANDKLGEIDNGIQDFSTVLELDPYHVNAAYARGACQNRKGNYAQAIEDYSMALERDQEGRRSPGKPQKRYLQSSFSNTANSIDAKDDPFSFVPPPRSGTPQKFEKEKEMTDPEPPPRLAKPQIMSKTGSTQSSKASLAINLSEKALKEAE